MNKPDHVKGLDKTDPGSLLEAARRIFEEYIPFNKFLGLKIQSMEMDNVRLRMRIKDELIGNFTTEILHGGVISSILDVTGGVTTFLGHFHRLQDRPVEEVSQKFSKLGTIDLRVDFLRPGRGKEFVSTGSVLRTGKKVTVTRMELYNEDGEFIAAGTGTYVMG